MIGVDRIGLVCFYIAGAWLAWVGRWWGVMAFAFIAVCDAIGERLIYWQRKRIDFLEDTTEIPQGFVRVKVPGNPPVVVPATEEAIAAVRHLVQIVEGEQP